MEEHLKQLCNENPLLLTTIQGAIFSGYEQAKRFVIQNGCESIQRDGYARHVCIEPCVFRAIEEARFSGVTLSCPNNIGKTAKHLEIRTPHAILMIASGRNTSKPPKAKYRQQTIDQFYYGQQVLPGVFQSDELSPPLYIITHAPDRRKNSVTPAVICIGRPSVDQLSWSCFYKFDDLGLENYATENIAVRESVSLKETVVKTTTLSLKKA